MQKYWENHVHKIQGITSFSEMVALAHEVIDELPPGEIGMVSGPISTGGLGSVELNLQKLRETIEELNLRGHVIFDQLPLEAKIGELIAHVSGRYPMEILEDFYLPIFQSGKIKNFFFIQGWESSFGASWENKTIKELGIKDFYL